MKVEDHRGWITKLRRALPPRASRCLRDTSLWFSRRLPIILKYRIAGAIQRRRYPYKLLEEGDRVVQIGAPRDILDGGRSRAIHFALRVGGAGHVLVIEADPLSVAALQRFVHRYNLADRVTVVNLGVWKNRRALRFIVNELHPAANRLADLASESNVCKTVEDGCKIVTIEADSLGNILQQHRFQTPKLISITTNGAEREILSGLWAAGESYVPRFLSLAPPNDANITAMEEHGYCWIAWDDRGQLFERNT